MPPEIIKKLSEKGIAQTEHTSFDEPLPFTDVLYVTRIQSERFVNKEDYEKVRNSYCVTPKTLAQSKPRVVMHPLPRVNEISPDVDVDPSAAYFRQMENGMFVRMALLSLILGKQREQQSPVHQ
jgi:aspartate carbamoyltransferase catalytic subunit